MEESLLDFLCVFGRGCSQNISWVYIEVQIGLDLEADSDQQNFILKKVLNAKTDELVEHTPTRNRDRFCLVSALKKISEYLFYILGNFVI